MKKLFLCVTAAALLAAPTFAVALDKLKIDVNVPINSDGNQSGNTIYGNNNNQTGNIRSSVSIASFETSSMSGPRREDLIIILPLGQLPDNVTVSGSVNAGHSAAQLSVINGVTMPVVEDEEYPEKPIYNVNQGVNNTTTESIVGNNIRVKPSIDTEDLLASIEDLLVNDISFDGHWTHNHHFNGGFYSND